MAEFLHFLQGTMKTPKLMGWYHIICLIICIFLCLLIYYLRHKITEKQIKNILLFAGIVFILFEVYKLLISSFYYQPNGNSYWKFPWASFPFQFCSTPMYILLLAGILRKGKVYESCKCYLATYSLFAGGFVTLFPGNVFSTKIGINIQTMVVHGGMFVIAFLLLVTKSVQHNFKTVLKGSAVFICTLSLALIMNIIWHYCGNEEIFNMFYISPYYPCEVPVLNVIYKVMPYPIFFMIYAFGFFGISTAIIFITITLDYTAEYLRIKRMFPEDNVTPKIVRIIKKELK